jgi:hypothetical protein
MDSKTAVEFMAIVGQTRDELIRKIQKGSVDYRSGYVDACLDMFNGMKAKAEPHQIKVG